MLAAANDGHDGWVRSKRERGVCVEYGTNVGLQIGTSEGTKHAILNLNFSPWRVKEADAMHGRGDRAEQKNNVVNTGGQRRGSGRGTGRGTTRIRRPPLVVPRFHSTASTRTSSPARKCILLLSFVSMQSYGKV